MFTEARFEKHPTHAHDGYIAERTRPKTRAAVLLAGMALFGALTSPSTEAATKKASKPKTTKAPKTTTTTSTVPQTSTTLLQSTTTSTIPQIQETFPEIQARLYGLASESGMNEFSMWVVGKVEPAIGTKKGSQYDELAFSFKCLEKPYGTVIQNTSGTQQNQRTVWNTLLENAGVDPAGATMYLRHRSPGDAGLAAEGKMSFALAKGQDPAQMASRLFASAGSLTAMFTSCNSLTEPQNSTFFKPGSAESSRVEQFTTIYNLFNANRDAAAINEVFAYAMFPDYLKTESPAESDLALYSYYMCIPPYRVKGGVGAGGAFWAPLLKGTVNFEVGKSDFLGATRLPDGTYPLADIRIANEKPGDVAVEFVKKVPGFPVAMCKPPVFN